MNAVEFLKQKSVITKLKEEEEEELIEYKNPVNIYFILACNNALLDEKEVKNDNL